MRGKQIWVDEKFYRKLRKMYKDFIRETNMDISFIKFTKIASAFLNGSKKVTVIVRKKKRVYDVEDEFEF